MKQILKNFINGIRFFITFISIEIAIAFFLYHLNVLIHFGQPSVPTITPDRLFDMIILVPLALIGFVFMMWRVDWLVDIFQPNKSK